jgi:hypothetical protein
MKKSIGSVSVTPNSAEVSLTACSPMSSAFFANASPPSVQWTVMRSPSRVFQSWLVSRYRIRSVVLRTGSAPTAGKAAHVYVSGVFGTR